MPDPTGKDLFDACFEEGDEVVVIDIDDNLWWGRLKNITTRGLEVRKGGWVRSFIGDKKKLEWDDIRFMAHDGFPVRKLMGADGSRTIEKLDTRETRTAVRAALKQEFPSQPERRTVRFGDPFDAECVSTRLYHPGNSGPEYWDQFYNRTLQQYYSPEHRQEAFDKEEVIVMEAVDGAKAELWDLTTLYMFE